MRLGVPSVYGGGLWSAGLDDDFPDLPSFGFLGRYGPPALVEIWAEKTTMNDILLPLARALRREPDHRRRRDEPNAGPAFSGTRADGGRAVRGSSTSPTSTPAGRSMPVAVARKIEFALDAGPTST